jgi:hypothetical protein
MKSLVLMVLAALAPLAAETLQMDKPVTSAASGLEVTVMANPVGTIPILAQYAPHVKTGIMVLIKNSTALTDADTFLVTVSYHDADKARQNQTVVARTTGVNANYTSAIIWIDPATVSWLSINQAKTVPVSVQFGPTAQFEVLGETMRLETPPAE